ncbi:hypothetical protein K437DRAFT_51261 [Tilletiaria anomala UBC 951]|uniref:Uncharacterized protein n=1 Tax=Tilletiaria anomala (strain ATCC 24038 / CBS 436.72 / UBC 951) TaxID=1037660 RepID=A0A066WK71_TILAU|nr:uncharacterized protein K437DRAFT_51261 [Tilletiaria anomala UBC 951]KDN51414.1 hypothetical protein K437DRAFT_51261 [Tilletiaria anomala UBC 951]
MWKEDYCPPSLECSDRAIDDREWPNAGGDVGASSGIPDLVAAQSNDADVLSTYKLDMLRFKSFNRLNRSAGVVTCSVANKSHIRHSLSHCVLLAASCTASAKHFLPVKYNVLTVIVYGCAACRLLGPGACTATLPDIQGPILWAFSSRQQDTNALRYGRTAILLPFELGLHSVAQTPLRWTLNK